MISVIVPIYNTEKYLPECIESIIRQTYEDIEIILVDDGSTDESPRICDTYAEKDSRIKVIHKENGGLVSARKVGIAAAQGRYITYVDSDDWVEPDMLQKLMELGVDADIITYAGYEEGGGYRGPKKNAVAEGMYNSPEQLKSLYGKMLMTDTFFEYGILPYLWSKLFKKDLLKKVQITMEDILYIGEDAACVYPCILMAGSVYVTNLDLYHYRVRPDSITKSQKFCFEHLKCLYQTLESYFDIHGQREILNLQLQYYRWYILLFAGYHFIHSPMALFPFEKVKSGMRVAVYGAGVFGQVIEQYCQTSDTLSVAGWFDQRYDIYHKQGLLVQSPDEVVNTDFDVMVIAIENVDTAESIKASFVQQGIPAEKIDYISTEVLEMSDLPEGLN